MDELRDPQYKSPDGSALRIWRDTAQNKFLSEREGRAIFDEVIYVEVISPGSRDSTPTFELKRMYAPEMNHPAPKFGIKYPEYKEFVTDFEKSEAADETLAGTPLSQWPEMTRTMAASLKVQNIFTVDALANLPDTKIQVVGPDGRTWREKAKAYIENAKSGAYATKLAADLEVMKLDLATEQEKSKTLADQIKALQDAATGQAPPPPMAPLVPQEAFPPVADPLAPAPII